ncbi:MAG TPA: cbb3-type cytochrome oxidase assembly protein CcoS [Polyangiaceae bacterium]|nr:cbb3-type cytochrome oxidase assembly protein CcoS [Polyangiaceae bacterium]
MTVLFIVLPLAVLLSLLAALAFVWATRRGQFDDLDTPAVRLLCDDLGERPRLPSQKPSRSQP